MWWHSHTAGYVVATTSHLAYRTVASSRMDPRGEHASVGWQRWPLEGLLARDRCTVRRHCWFHVHQPAAAELDMEEREGNHCAIEPPERAIALRDWRKRFERPVEAVETLLAGQAG